MGFIKRTELSDRLSRMVGRDRRRSLRLARTLFLPHAAELECRALLSTLTVLNAKDDGAGSLRQAVATRASAAARLKRTTLRPAIGAMVPAW